MFFFQNCDKLNFRYSVTSSKLTLNYLPAVNYNFINVGSKTKTMDTLIHYLTQIKICVRVGVVFPLDMVNFGKEIFLFY